MCSFNVVNEPLNDSFVKAVLDGVSEPVVGLQVRELELGVDVAASLLRAESVHGRVAGHDPGRVQTGNRFGSCWKFPCFYICENFEERFERKITYTNLT